ncbi:Peroxisomal membrane protein PEX29 [Spathaspora sp. JA1]|nr:Peroxisomal membrane protein PEX29 [Spathaspora sp. JA1]
MDQVSNILGNILSIEETGSSTNVEKPSNNKSRRSRDFDFTSIWTSDEQTIDNNNDSRQPTNSSSSSQYMADKLMEKALAMIIPSEIHDYQTSKVIQDRIAIQKQRPSLSFNIMQKNSNSLHQRNSSSYVLINSIIQFFNWEDVYYTVGVLLIITHIILNPVLLTIVPLGLILVNVLIPHYLLIYVPDSTKYHEVNPIPADIPISKYKIAKPVPLFSQEFFLNLTDTQNFMSYYIDCYDFIVWITRDYLYFKDEQVSSIVLLVMLGIIVLNFYLVPMVVKFALLHIKFVKICLIGIVWLFLIMLHPNNRGVLLEWIYNEDTRLNFQNYVNRAEGRLTGLLDNQVEQEEEQEEIHVEIFELQKLNVSSKIWELIGFTPNFYTVNTATRKHNTNIAKQELDQLQEDSTWQQDSGKYLRIPRKDSLGEILPPQDYEFTGPWTIDYNVNNWVEENLIKDLVIIDDDEKWAYDYIEEDFNEINEEEEEIIEVDEGN